jgi:hypothetical protein
MCRHGAARLHAQQLWYLWRVHSLVNKQARYRRIGIA